MNETDKHFCNLVIAAGGIQATIKANGTEHRHYVSGYDNEAIRAALIARNDLYRQLDVLARRILLRPSATEAKRSSRSNTGWLGVYYATQTGRNGPGGAVLSIRARHLLTGKLTNTKLPLTCFASERAALRAAKGLIKRNALAYNAIVNEYNRTVWIDALKIAEQEVKTLTPKLHTLRGVDRQRWARARETVFGAGLAHTIDPGTKVAKQLAIEANQ